MSEQKPKISVMIPTLQSEAYIEQCLTTIVNQKYSPLEVILIDGGSKDATVALAKKVFPEVIVHVVPNGLLRARAKGITTATGEFGLLLDADQVLADGVFDRAIAMMADKNLDMLVFEEFVYQPKTFLEKLFVLDRRLIHEVRDFSPETGVMLPRFFKIELLRKAISVIPAEALDTGDRDHAIIYAESFALSQRVGLLESAVYHREPSSLLNIIKKFYRWGSTNLPAQHPRYKAMLAKKEGFRKGLFTRGLIIESLGSITLLLIKGVPYKIGYYVAWLKKKV
jgi:glycosyltransferase involved in cell wall biosynthesis